MKEPASMSLLPALHSPSMGIATPAWKDIISTEPFVGPIPKIFSMETPATSRAKHAWTTTKHFASVASFIINFKEPNTVLA